jgi:hypothetical protein
MESLAIAFVIGIFFYLNAPTKPPKPKDPWEEMGKAIGTALKTLFPSGEDKKKDDKSKSNNKELPWIMIFSGIIGLFLLFNS